MKMSKDQTVRGLQLSLLVAMVLLIPLTLLLNCMSHGNTQGFILDRLFASSPLPGREPSVETVPISSTDHQHSVNRSDVRRQREFQPTSIPHYSFVKFSAYRQSLHTFFVTGITSQVARTYDREKIVHLCEWHPAEGALPVNDSRGYLQTEARIIYMTSDDNHGTYSPAVVNCTFADEVGADRQGGVLVLRISTGYGRWGPHVPAVALEELPGEIDVVISPPEKLPFKYAFCGAPLHGTLRVDWILQWITYHNYLAEGKAHFFFYNMGGLPETDLKMLKKFLDARILSITDILDPNLEQDYPTCYFHQVLLINDCLHRSRFVAERAFFFDYDEFLQVPPPDTFSAFMARHQDEPWISFGNIYANTEECRDVQDGDSDAPLERLVWHRPEPECRENLNTSNPWLCIGPLGRRKYVVNPQKTFAGGVHWALIPETGLNLMAQEARMLHYRSAPLPGFKICVRNVTLNGTEEKRVLDAGWIRDETVSKIYAQAKLFPV